MHCRGGPNTAAADGPGGPIVAGDHRRRDSSPHRAQTAYRKRVSYADAIFCTKETFLKMSEKAKILCCFDLEKAFDSIEYNVLFSHIFIIIGINGMCWQIVKNWCSNPINSIRINSQYSISILWVIVV